MKNVLGKIALARVYIKSHPLKKDGRNEYSKYDYFTPEIVSKLVNEACNESNIICIFSLKQDTLGYYGEVSTTDLETGETLITEMRTEKPVITATNATQQMGGMNTYTKRYCLMSLFDIEDNTIDFDSQDNSKHQPATSASKVGNNGIELPWLNENTKEFEGAVKKLRAGTTTIEKIKAVFRISKAIDLKLKEAIQQPV